MTEEKVRFAYETEVFYSMLDSLELCQFVYGTTWTLYDGDTDRRDGACRSRLDITLNELMKWVPSSAIPYVQCPRGTGRRTTNCQRNLQSPECTARPRASL